MSIQRPRLYVVDDERAVLSLAGTGISCLDVLRALRHLNPQCEAVLMTGYETLGAALDALRYDTEGHLRPYQASVEPATPVPAPLIDVQREHIVRTLQLARGNKAVAARLLGVSRRAFYRQLERHGLHRRVPAGPRAEPTAVRSEKARGD